MMIRKIRNHEEVIDNILKKIFQCVCYYGSLQCFDLGQLNALFVAARFWILATFVCQSKVHLVDSLMSSRSHALPIPLSQN